MLNLVMVFCLSPEPFGSSPRSAAGGPFQYGAVLTAGLEDLSNHPKKALKHLKQESKGRARNQLDMVGEGATEKLVGRGVPKPKSLSWQCRECG